MPSSRSFNFGANSWYFAGRCFSNTSGGSTTWSSTLTRIRSSRFIAAPKGSECDGASRMIVDTFLTAPGGRAPTKEVRVSYESTANPIKVGYLMDFVLPAEYPQDRRLDLTQSLDLVFERGYRDGVIDRPIEVVYREVEGPPEGIGQGGHRRVRRARRRGLPRRVRALHHRQLRTDTRRDRAPLRGAGDQRDRIRSVVGSVDVLTADGITHRRAGLLGRADGQRRISDRRRAGRALARRAHLHHQLPRRPANGPGSGSSPSR